MPGMLSSADLGPSPGSENFLHGSCECLWALRRLDLLEILSSFNTQILPTFLKIVIKNVTFSPSVNFGELALPFMKNWAQ